jgi:hypothetical protein
VGVFGAETVRFMGKKITLGSNTEQKKHGCDVFFLQRNIFYRFTYFTYFTRNTIIRGILELFDDVAIENFYCNI